MGELVAAQCVILNPVRHGVFKARHSNGTYTVDSLHLHPLLTPSNTMGWPGHLTLNYRCETTSTGSRTVLHDRHSGPLRVLQSLYPEAHQVCHNVLVHPPGGIVGGDDLVIEAHLQTGSHALISTPGATRFYRSSGEAARQTIHFKLDAGARLEWLPLETIVHSAALAENRMLFDLQPGAEMVGWDVLALGLPASGQGFKSGHMRQEIEVPGLWLERAKVAADDHTLLRSPLGWDGQTVLATLWFAAGSHQPIHRLQALLEEARLHIDASSTAARAGCTRLGEQGVVLRVLAPQVEPAMLLLQQVWATWRQLAWGLAACPPRVWKL
jgi:urease accessory protein